MPGTAGMPKAKDAHPEAEGGRHLLLFNVRRSIIKRKSAVDDTGLIFLITVKKLDPRTKLAPVPGVKTRLCRCPSVTTGEASRVISMFPRLAV